MITRVFSLLSLALLLTACGGGSSNTSGTGNSNGSGNTSGTGSSNGSSNTSGTGNSSGSSVPCINKFGSNWNKVDYWENPASNSPQVGYVATGNGKYVIAGWGAAYSSSNAGTWSVIPSLVNKQIEGLTYGKGVFVALGNVVGLGGNSAYISVDGVNWTTRLINGPNGSVKDLPIFRTQDMVYGNDKFVAIVMSSGLEGFTLMNSTDGLNWRKVSNFPYNSSPRQNIASWIGFTNGLFYLVDVINLRQMYTSIDGENWNTVSIIGDGVFPSGIISGIQYINGQYIATDINGVIANSKDAINWRAISKIKSTMGLGNSVVSGSGQVMIVDHDRENSMVYYSCDGTQWNFTPIRLGSFGARTAIGDSAAVILNSGPMLISRF